MASKSPVGTWRVTTPNRAKCLLQELAAAMVAFIEKDNLISRIQLSHEQADDRRHPARENDRFFRVVQCREFGFDNLLVRAAVATILFAWLLLFDEIDNALRRFESIRAATANRISDSMRRLMSRLARVDTTSTSTR